MLLHSGLEQCFQRMAANAPAPMDTQTEQGEKRYVDARNRVIMLCCLLLAVCSCETIFSFVRGLCV